MKSSDRLLALFSGAIGLLALLTLLLVINVKNKPVILLPENSPGGVVQRYLMAIDSGDYLSAFNYLSLPSGDPTTYDVWRQSFNFQASRPTYEARLNQTQVTGATAEVDMVIEVFGRGGGIFGDQAHSNNIVFLLKMINGAWEIYSPTDIWWMY